MVSIVMVGDGPPSTFAVCFNKDVNADLRRHDANRMPRVKTQRDHALTTSKRLAGTARQPNITTQDDQGALHSSRTTQSPRLTALGRNRMAKAPPSSNRPKREKVAHPPGVDNPVGSRAGKTLANSKADRISASRILRDIREKASDLSARADRLLRRVS
jgi:hypothetical protein